MPRHRYQPPDRMLRAADFSTDDQLRGSLNTVKLVKSQPWAWDQLREACELEVKHARKREPGHWELAAIAFVASRQVDIQPFWDESSEELWIECGFVEKPPYLRVWRRLRELETVCEEFLKAAAQIIQRCKTHDPRVMAHVHFDYTEDETHAALVHDCQKGEACKYAKATEGGKRVRGYAKRPQRVSAQVAREERHELSAEDPAVAEEREAKSAPEKTQTVQRGTQTIKRVRMRGCWFRTLDLEAGVRQYSGPRGRRKFWHGYYGGKAIDHFTGGLIPSVDSASTNECHLFPQLFDRVKTMAGDAPETAIADRGMSIASCFEHATKNGTAAVFPWRKYGDGIRHDHETHDRHGVPRCKHCGGETEQVRFSAANGHPRLWFRCMYPDPKTPGCEKEQTIACKTDWRSLIPLARTEPLYHELKQSHQSFEHAHDLWRDRYRVSADTLGIRPKAVGLDWHRLRANVACLIDWLRIAAKNDWLGAKSSGKKTSLIAKRKFQSRGRKAAEELADERARVGLGRPYGAVAATLGLCPKEPPSRRRRKPPPRPAPAAT
jgi:hypothetical protein